MSQLGINLYEFRKEFNIPAADIRSIIKQLKLRTIKKDGDEFIVEGSKKYKCGIEYLLKHAVLEYRATMRIDNTLAGKFIEYEHETSKGVVHFGISDFSSNAVKPKTPAIKLKPNKKKGVKIIDNAKQPVGITKQSQPPKTPKTPEPKGKVKTAEKPPQTPPEPPVTPLNPSTASDVLAPQKELLNAAEQGFLVTSEQLAALIGLSAETIRSKKSGFRKLGFEFAKVREGANTLWKPSQY